MRRIVCVGNRLREDDSAGPLVHDRLRRSPLPEGVELVDGGLAGLDLVRWIEGADRVVFVDSLRGEGTDTAVTVLGADEVATGVRESWDHAAGLGYLLAALPRLIDGPPPPIWVVGVAGGATPEVVDQAAEASLRVILSRGSSSRT